MGQEILPTEQDLEDIQGNILGGFKQDSQTFLFFTIPQGCRVKHWLGEISEDIASSAQVLANNREFKARARKTGGNPDANAVFLNVALTQKGLAAIGVSDADLAAMPEDFRQGMRARAELIGDVDGSAPANWVGRFAHEDPHVALILAADDEHRHHELVLHHLALAASHGLQLMHLQTGHTRVDQPGHEHFGFKDGISQPGVRGVDLPDDPIGNPDQGQPGQDLLFPGEFVIGYTAQNPDDEEEPGEVRNVGPGWTRNGSFLVYRRLRQDVFGFRKFVAEAALKTGESPELTGARLVGRYKSGAPLEKLKDPGFPNPIEGDPSNVDPRVLERAHINNFEYGDDPDGKFVPHSAHIRKVYPRDQDPPKEAGSQIRRILRRGIPFGRSFRPGEPAELKFPFDRGLNFLAYQSSLEDQFEFLQTKWVNNKDFPHAEDGQDPIIAQKDATRTFNFTAKSGKAAHLVLMKRWVTTTAGAYLFSPAISVIKGWAH